MNITQIIIVAIVAFLAVTLALVAVLLYAKATMATMLIVTGKQIGRAHV